MIPAPTQSDALAALRSFLTAVLPDDWKVVAGQDNRVAEDAGAKFVVMQPPRFARLATNLDSAADVKFTGSIAGTALTVTDVAFGVIEPGATVFGVGVAAGTKIVSGPGGVGSYVVSTSQTLASGTLSSGAKSAEQAAEVTVQIDFHADDGTSGDAAQVVSTLFRDEYATSQFADQDPARDVAPLHADDPRQIPFFNEEQQVEWRWVLDVCMQANQVVSVPQQYADSVEVELVSVDAAYPP